MSEDKLIEKARAFAKSGELQRAKDILEALDSERAKNLLNKVNSAIAAKKQEALANRANVPKEKPKNASLSSQIAEGIKQAKAEEKQAKAKQQGIGCLVLLAICGACWLFYLFTSQPGLERSQATICVDALQGMPMGTQCVLERFPEAVEFCYNRVGNADDTNLNDWYDCLLTQGVGTNMLDFPD